MIVVDVETSGLDPRKHGILSIGAVYGRSLFYHEAALLETQEVDHTALSVNGVAAPYDGPPIRKAMKSFYTWVGEVPKEDRVMAGHNPFFDAAFLKAADSQWPFHFRMIDLHSLAYMKFKESLSLNQILERLGLPPEPNPHHALVGAMLEKCAFTRLGVD